MTRTTNARLAGFAFLAYIAAGIASMVLFGRVTGGEGIAAKLTAIGQHPGTVGVVAVLGLIMAFSALALAVTLYAITRNQDPDLAMLGLACRVTEGVIGGVGIQNTLDLLWLATANGADAPAPIAATALGAYLLRGEVAVSGSFFAVGSLLFSWLLLRGRMIPIPLAWIGVIASILLVIGLPLKLAGALPASVASLLWFPMLAYEVPLGFWFLTRGAAAPARSVGW